MKKNILNILLTAGVVLGMASCQKSVIAPLEGLHKAPVKVEATECTDSWEKVGNLREFTFELTAGADKATFVLVGSTYFLPVNSYAEAAAEAAKNGNFVLGKTVVNGKAATDGSVVVTKTGDAKSYTPEDVYTFDAMLFLEDGSAYNIIWSGKLVYEPELQVIEMTKVASVRNNVPEGGKTVTLNLATDGIQYFTFDWTTWSGFYSGGTGQVFALDLYSADGQIHEGTYAAGDSNALAPNQFGCTYTLFGFAPNHGTCLWDVNNGVLTANAITSGTVTVAKDGDNWNIEYTDTAMQVVYSGPVLGL